MRGDIQKEKFVGIANSASQRTTDESKNKPQKIRSRCNGLWPTLLQRIGSARCQTKSYEATHWMKASAKHFFIILPMEK